MGKRRLSKPHLTKPLNVYTEAIIGALDFLAFGLAFSGKLDMNASRFFFLLALAIMLRRLYRHLPPRQFPKSFWGGSAGMTLTALTLMWWVQPELILQHSGTLTPKNGLLFPFHEKHPQPTLEIGNSCKSFIYTGPEGRLFHVLELSSLNIDSSLSIESIHGSVKVSTTIRDNSGKVVAKLKQNKWEVAPYPGSFDLNYTDDALEVIDARDSVVLQVRILPDRIQLQGEWWNDRGQGVRVVQSPGGPLGRHGIIAYLPRDPTDGFLPEIERIFEYPSKTHLGELRTPHITPSSCPPELHASPPSK